MNKTQYLSELKRGLSQLPNAEIEKQLSYYSELIDDMLEDGMSEEEATERLGPVKELCDKILQDMPLSTLVKSRSKPKGGWTALSIVLIVLGSPIWLSIAISIFAVALSIVVVFWAVVISIFAVALALAVCVPVCLLLAIRVLLVSIPSALLSFGLVLITAGLAILFFIGAVALSKLTVKLIVLVGKGIKRLFIRKEK